MTHQKALKTGIIAVILLVTVILATQQQPIQASNDRQVNSNDDAVSAGWNAQEGLGRQPGSDPQ